MIPACCESTHMPRDTAQHFAPCHKLVGLHEHSDPAEVFSHPQESCQSPGVCVWLLHHFSATGKAKGAGAGRGSGSCSLQGSEGKEQNQARAGEGAHGAQQHCQHRGSKQAPSWGRHRHVDRGYCRIQKSAQKIYKGSERGQRREHQSSHLPASSHCCSRAFPGMANPIIPLGWGGSAGIREPTTAGPGSQPALWHEGSSLPGFVERLDHPSPCEQQVPAPELWGHTLLVPALAAGHFPG